MLEKIIGYLLASGGLIAIFVAAAKYFVSQEIKNNIQEILNKILVTLELKQTKEICQINHCNTNQRLDGMDKKLDTILEAITKRNVE